MSATPTPQHVSALELFSALTPEAIRERLAHLEAEADALRILLRAANRRERALQRQNPLTARGNAA